MAWIDPKVLDLVREAAGDEAWLAPAGAEERFDVLPLLVATDSAVDAFGRDVRRLRPNILVAGVDSLDECGGRAQAFASGRPRFASTRCDSVAR